MAFLLQTTKAGIQRRQEQNKRRRSEARIQVRTPPWGALIGAEPTGCAYTSLWIASFWNPFCSLDQEALQELLVKPAYRNLLVSAVGIGGRGSRKLGTSLSFCDRAKPSGVIFDSSNSFIPHIQAVSKSRKRCFENVSVYS